MVENKEMFSFAFLSALLSTFVFLYEEGKTKKYSNYVRETDGKVCIKKVLMDTILHIGIGMVGFVLVYLAFTTPLLKDYKEYFPLIAVIFSILAERLLPILFDLVLFEVNHRANSYKKSKISLDDKIDNLSKKIDEIKK